jgi:hypothetical protein
MIILKRELYMKKKFCLYFILIFNLFSIKADSDFFGQVLCNLRNSINKIPIIISKIPILLTSNPVLALGILSTFYLSLKEYKSIPLIRSFKKLNEISIKQKGYLLHNSLLRKNPECLKELLIKEASQYYNKDIAIPLLIKRINDLDINKIVNLIKSKDNKIKKNNGLSEELIKIDNDLEDVDTEVCILKSVFKTLEKEGIEYFDKDNLSVIGSSWIKKLLYFSEISFFISLFFISYNNF